MPLLSFIAILLLAPAPRQVYDEPSLQDRIVKAVMTTLATRFPDDVHRLSVRVIRTGGKLDIDQPVRLDLPSSAALPRAHLQAKVYQPTDALWQEKGWVMLYVSHFDSVGVTVKPVKKDERITTEDIRFSWLETTRFRGDPLTPAKVHRLFSQGDVFAHRHLKEERSLRADDVRNALDVELGQAVVMTYRRNQFALELTCKARTQGFAGDEIKLFAPATNKTYRVLITGPGKADWLETLE